MATTLTGHWFSSSTSRRPSPAEDVTLQLSTRTWSLLINRPHEQELVHSVWERLEELERSGYDAGGMAALRFVLVHHQPSASRRCRACRRWGWQRLWQRRSWPCVIWSQVHYELVGGTYTGGRHHLR